MDVFWQQVIIGVALLAAIGYLVRRAIRPAKEGTACSRCHCKKKNILDRGDLRRL